MNVIIDLPNKMFAKVTIDTDQDADNPAEERDMAHFYVAQSRHEFERYMHKLSLSPYDIEALKRGGTVTVDGKVYMGLERYRHSCDALAICGQGRFPDRQWDVSPIVGFITPHEDVDSDVIESFFKLRAENPEAARKLISDRLNQDINTMNLWLNGEVYSYEMEVYTANGAPLMEEPENLCGCYGYDDCLEEAKMSAYATALSVLSAADLSLSIELGRSKEKPEGFEEFILTWMKNTFQGELDKTPSIIAAQKIFDKFSTSLSSCALTPELLVSRAGGSVWDEHHEHKRADWRQEVSEDNTILGYWEWVSHQVVAEDSDE
jgi:hypothetical protein